MITWQGRCCGPNAPGPLCTLYCILDCAAGSLLRTDAARDGWVRVEEDFLEDGDGSLGSNLLPASSRLCPRPPRFILYTLYCILYTLVAAPDRPASRVLPLYVCTLYWLPADRSRSSLSWLNPSHHRQSRRQLYLYFILHTSHHRPVTASAMGYEVDDEEEGEQQVGSIK